MPTRDVTLTAEQDAYIESAVRSGRHENASDLIRDAIRELQKSEAEDQAKLEALKLAISEGFEGPLLDGPTVMAELLRSKAARQNRIVRSS